MVHWSAKLCNFQCCCSSELSCVSDKQKCTRGIDSNHEAVPAFSDRESTVIVLHDSMGRFYWVGAFQTCQLPSSKPPERLLASTFSKRSHHLPTEQDPLSQGTISPSLLIVGSLSLLCLASVCLHAT